MKIVEASQVHAPEDKAKADEDAMDLDDHEDEEAKKLEEERIAKIAEVEAEFQKKLEDLKKRGKNPDDKAAKANL